MNDINNNIVVGILVIVMGLISAIFSKQHAKATSDFYFNLFKVRSSEKWNQLGFFWGGIFFIIFGILVLLELLDLRS